MKKICMILFVTMAFKSYAQDKGDSDIKKSLLKEFSEKACECIDTINHANKLKPDVAREINACINQYVTAYQLGSKLSGITDVEDKKGKKKNKKKEVNINVNPNENSDEYKTYYYEMERYLMTNCKAVKQKIASNEKLNKHSMSEDRVALAAYDRGIDEMKQGLYQTAIPYFEKAVIADSLFAFAWDNLGICYRKLEKYDLAVKAYSRSLEIDPEGITPLQNIAIVYRLQKDYPNAIKAYEKITAINKNDPEAYYGLGHMYAAELGELEKGLDHLCKAYNIYVADKSPYRTDAETLISLIYKEMKEKGKEKEFKEILKKNNISTQ